MPKIERLKGAVSIASNSYGAATGYGQQVKQLADRLLKHGIKVANLSNFGLEGSISRIRTKHGDIDHYPKGFLPYSQDVLKLWHEHFTAQHPHLPNMLITLYDTWVYEKSVIGTDLHAWTPIDHTNMPQQVLQTLQKPHIKPISMAPHGQRAMDAVGIENTYIPHGIDTTVYKPSDHWEGQSIRAMMDVPDGGFLVTIMAANKANGVVHRKSIAEALLSFALFRERHKDAYLYLHTEASNAYGGFNIAGLIKACGLDDKSVRVADGQQLRTGYPQEALAAIYSTSDVVMNISMGEGFGLGTIEAQACGSKVIGGAWTATTDLLSENCYAIAGQPWWNETQKAWWMIPLIDSVVNALEMAYNEPRGTDDACVEFARQFDADKVFEEKWIPYLKEHLDQ